MTRLRGLATGTGSFPHKDAQAAVDLVFKYIPNIPFWPQLPRLTPREGMIAQFSENFPCLAVSDDGVFYRTSDKEKDLEKFYEKVIEEDLDYFKITPNCSQGVYAFHRQLAKTNLKDVEFIKCHITGPFTFAASLKDERDVLLLHDPVFLQVFIKGLVMKALWQVKLFSGFGKKIIVFIDEPYLGCFGSAYTPITREQVVSGLKEFTQGIKSDNVLVGLHCCGNTDWSIFTDVDSIDIINFDAYDFLDKFVLYARDLDGFLKRNGIICWGVVPTRQPNEAVSAEILCQRLSLGIEVLVKKGVDKKLVTDNLLVSPACGLGTLTVSAAQELLELLSAVSKTLQKT